MQYQPCCGFEIISSGSMAWNNFELGIALLSRSGMPEIAGFFGRHVIEARAPGFVNFPHCSAELPERVKERKSALSPSR
ncbi:hypothetical protein [Methylocystis echinoides]|uniref:hypothetical protein n=1 Tax=Methylocystis echinoides TaxID=29468 RepID=UPI002491E8CB|nr:hypothetical protein [Methylocystis echinoides]